MEVNNNCSGKHEVFCRFIRKNGRIIYPKNAKFFHFWVDDAPVKNQKPTQISVFDDEK